MSNAVQRPRFLAAGDGAVTIEFGDEIDPAVNARVLALDAALRACQVAGVIETVPTYRSLLVQFNPLIFDYDGFLVMVDRLLAGIDAAPLRGRRWKVPVVYGGTYGIDLEEVAAQRNLTPRQIIEIHSAPVYRIYMIGFMPGLAYLGGLDPAIMMPRRRDPRPLTPSGTISIGGNQALIASVAMPSGWHLLGRTPVRTFMLERNPVFLLEAGDEVVFEPIAAARWAALDERAAAGDPVAELIDP
jgi:KipI family sensor histidine kinase inhibitor